MKVHETANLSYLYRLKSYHNMPPPAKSLEKQWIILYDQYIKEFGINEQYEKYLHKKRKIAIMKCDLVITDDNIHKTFIKIEQMKLSDMLDKNQLVKFMDVVSMLTKFLGVAINTKAISVLEYYSYLRYLEKSSNNSA